MSTYYSLSHAAFLKLRGHYSKCYKPAMKIKRYIFPFHSPLSVALTHLITNGFHSKEARSEITGGMRVMFYAAGQKNILRYLSLHSGWENFKQRFIQICTLTKRKVGDCVSRTQKV